MGVPPPPGGLRQEPHTVSCRNRAGHFQWVFPISRGLFSLLLGGLNISASREQPGELQLGQPTFRMTLLRDSVRKYRCQRCQAFLSA